jgi:hypothetical protein
VSIFEADQYLVDEVVHQEKTSAHHG